MSEKTIGNLLTAEPLSDGDYLAVNQPNVFNALAQRNGDTRKIMVAELGDYINRTAQKASVGEYHYLAFQPTPLWLAKKRYLVLNYQIIEIALYQDLCDLMWCGASLNATAPFWYKCNADGTRNVNGLYMRVADGRGMFWRGAGANAVFKGANDTPYDGNSIGAFIGDAIREIWGRVGASGSGMRMQNPTGAFGGWSYDSPLYTEGSTSGLGDLIFAASNVVPVAYENRPASISALVCISY